MAAQFLNRVGPTRYSRLPTFRTVNDFCLDKKISLYFPFHNVGRSADEYLESNAPQDGFIAHDVFIQILAKINLCKVKKSVLCLALFLFLFRGENLDKFIL